MKLRLCLAAGPRLGLDMEAARGLFFILFFIFIMVIVNFPVAASRCAKTNMLAGVKAGTEG